MKKFIFLATALLISLSSVKAETASVIIPAPLVVESQSGEFLLSSQCSICAESEELVAPATIFAESVKEFVGGVMKVRRASTRKGAINLALNPSLADEEYRLTVETRRIAIEGGSARAVFYALQSLRQIIAAAENSTKGVAIAAVKIEDKPFFGYRGAMLDVCRHIFTVEEVKRYIDILAMHKINRLHWHLTEDQGWRIEIKRYPELAKVGAYRKETLVGRYRKSTTYDGKPYGGIFTQDEVREIVRYASERYMEVIPEIEMPGHAVAALATFPHLGCTGGPYEVRTTWGISKEVYCAGKESTFEFIENVLSEVLELFPSKYIHIGGDECPKDAWKVCEACQKRIADEGLASEEQLQSYFMRRVEHWLNERGRSVIGWDEILQGGVTKSATIMSWRGTKGGIAAAKMGNNVIMTPNTYCYIDYYQTSDPVANKEPLANGRRPLPLERVYSFDPYEGLNEVEQGYIKGVQVNLWTEYIPTFDHVQHMLLPRLAAIAEVGWSYPRKDYSDFSRRMHILRGLYDHEKYNYAPYFFNGIE